MKKSDFPIPIEEIAAKTYVDERVGSEVKLQVGIVEERFVHEFKILGEGQQGLVEHLERFELETGHNFKSVYKRLDTITIDLGNVVVKVDRLENKFNGLENKFGGLANRFYGLENKFDLVISEIRELKEKIEK